MMPMKKSGPEEKKWPYKKFIIKAWTGNDVVVEFNQNQDRFDYDLIEITIGGERALIARDDLAQVIMVGHEATKEYEKDLALSELDLRKKGVL